MSAVSQQSCQSSVSHVSQPHTCETRPPPLRTSGSRPWQAMAMPPPRQAGLTAAHATAAPRASSLARCMGVGWPPRRSCGALRMSCGRRATRCSDNGCTRPRRSTTPRCCASWRRRSQALSSRAQQLCGRPAHSTALVRRSDLAELLLLLQMLLLLCTSRDCRDCTCG
eukprot:COSAG01_NODE_2629_length_7348_cov_14.364414_4_plen_168_part_00